LVWLGAWRTSSGVSLHRWVVLFVCVPSEPILPNVESGF
jgi:hypothetical protein